MDMIESQTMTGRQRQFAWQRRAQPADAKPAPRHVRKERR
jgi:hypothetical protein